jgi:hypothetical protein
MNTLQSRLLASTFLLALLLAPSVVLAGGAWVPDPGEGWMQLGASRKTAHTSWDANGDTLLNTGRFQNHDFRYGYLSGEAGVVDRLSATWVITYLDGLEGPTGDLHRNTGWSDAWLGLKYRLTDGPTPMALALTVRTPALYDQDGPYTLELYDDEGNFVALSDEWRGLLKHDVTLSYLASRSLWDGRGWGSVETGYTWREGAPADQIPLYAEVGAPLPWGGLKVKATGVAVWSLGNDSAREPDDRFGSRATFNFNDASMGRAGLSLILPLPGAAEGWSVEAGYNMWLWGRSARQYEEPFLSLVRTF